jgi:nondiscriminating glutamyl-tRNA synthetase
MKTPGARLSVDFHRSLVDADLLPRDLPPEGETWMVEVSDLLKKYVSHVAEVPAQAAPIFHDGKGPATDEAREVMTGEAAHAVVAALAEESRRGDPVDAESWQAIKRTLREATGAKGKELFQPLRVAVTGRTSGPELDRLVALVEQGHRLFPGPIPSVSERARRTLEWIDGE